MKKLFVFSLIFSLSFITLNAQEKKIAIIEPEGEVENYLKNIFWDELFFTLKKSSEYLVIEKDVLKKMLDENNFKNEILISDSQISELGKKMGIDLILATNLTKYGKNNFNFTGRLVNVHTQNIEKQTYEQTQKGMSDFEKMMQRFARAFQYGEIRGFADERQEKEEQERLERQVQEKALREAEERALEEQQALIEAEERELAKKEAKEKAQRESEELARAEQQALIEAEERKLAKKEAQERAQREAEEKAIAEQKTKEVKQSKCSSLFSNGKRTHDDANDVSNYKAAMDIFQEGLDLGCDVKEFTYWYNICKTKIDFLTATLDISSETLVVEASNSKNSITVNTNYNAWDIEPMPHTASAWLFGHKTDAQTLTVTCNENSSLQDRTGTITIKAGNKTEQLTVTQKGKKYLFPEVLKLIYSNLNSNSTVFPKSSIKHKGEKTSTGQRNGFGVQLWPDGNLFFGKIINGECTNGMFIDGEITVSLKRYVNKFQVGNFSGLQLNGEAKCYDENGILSYQGEFLNDTPYRSSYWTDNRYPSLKFEIFEINNGYYMGETKDGIRHGKGVYILKTGDMWYGDWLNGTKYYGIEIRMDGTTNVGSDFTE